MACLKQEGTVAAARELLKVTLGFKSALVLRFRLE